MAQTHTQGQRHDRFLNWPDHADISVDLDRSPPSGQPVPPPADTETSVAEKMLSAVSGSILTGFIVTPLDVVRVRLQAQSGPSPSAFASHRLPSFLQLPPNLGVTACCREVFWVQNQSQFCVAAPASLASPVVDTQHIVSDCAAEESQRRTFNSTLDGFRKIARNEGFFTLWRGLSPTLVMGVPANVIYFAGYDWLRTSPTSPMVGKISDDYAPLAAGSIARIGAATAVGPLEILRTRMQASQSGDKGILRDTVTGLKDMVAAEGYASLWRGLSLTLWRDVPFSALYWWGYELSRRRLNELRSQRSGEPTPSSLPSSALLTDSFIAGSISGGISAYVTTPFDVGKTRQQTVMDSGMSLEERRSLPESRSMPRFLLHIYRTEGMTGLFKGWVGRCAKVSTSCAIMISSYEIGKRMAIHRKDNIKGEE